MRLLFWIAVFIAAAVASHAAFALFAPPYLFSREVTRMAGTHGANSFFILAPDDQAKLLPGFPRVGVVGLCLFDVSKGDVTLAADLPDGFWVTTMYSARGEALYSLNNRQSGTNVFTVTLSRAPGFIEQLIAATDKEKPEIDSGWTVMSPDAHGLAVVWYPLTEPGLRPQIAEAMMKSRCAPVGG